MCALQKRELDFAVKRIQTLEQQVKRDRSIMAVLDSRNRTAALKVSSCPSISNRCRLGSGSLQSSRVCSRRSVRCCTVVPQSQNSARLAESEMLL